MRFLGTENNAYFINLEYRSEYYRLYFPSLEPEIVREVPYIKSWGNSVLQTIERMQRKRQKTSICEIYLSAFNIRVENEGNAIVPEVIFSAPFSEQLTILLSVPIQANRNLSGRFSVRLRGVVQKSHKL